LVSADREIEDAFAELVQRQVSALLVPDDVVLAGQRPQILTLATRYKLPAIYSSRTWTDAGGLTSYGPPVYDQARQAGIYTGRILKGEKPADLPVARATKFEFIVNLATSRAIGVALPPTLLARADEVIE
jgi:putative ABC transport system substrate-binding protein